MHVFSNVLKSFSVMITFSLSKFKNEKSPNGKNSFRIFFFISISGKFCRKKNFRVYTQMCVMMITS